MDIKEQAKYLLGRTSMSNVEIAATLGVTPAAISQFKTDPEFIKEIEEAKLVANLGAIRRDETINRIEDRVLAKLEKSVDFIFKPLELVKVAQVVNGLQRRSQRTGTLPGEGNGDQTIVNINLPANTGSIAVSVKLNTNNEIVEVGGRVMQTLPTSQVLAELDSYQQRKLVGRLEVSPSQQLVDL
jgi:hypothetical protein